MVSRGFRSLLMLAAAVVLSAPLMAQDALAWKFTAGEKLTYVVQQKTDTELDFGGRKQGVSMQQTMHMGWNIMDVASTGDAQMSQVVERVSMKSEGGPVGSFEYDSTASTPPESPLARTMADVFAKIIGQDFPITMKPSGKITKVTVPEGLLKTLSQAGAAGNAINEDTLKQMMTQSAITLPETPVKKGDTWETSQKVELPFGTMTVSSKLTYQGVDTSSGMARIDMKPSISMKAKDGAPLSLTVTKSDGKGTVLFDTAKGRIARSDLNVTMEMSVKQFGQTVNQTLKQETSMVLAP